ncbi:ATP-binding cassette domain-containing protein [Bacillus sp. PR5]|nr:ATP-binding cassette domain-containing protein [Bacillus sp. PR5]
MTEDVPVKVNGLNHWFGKGEARKQALFDVNLKVAGGSLTVLVGPSGSGKTTLLTLAGCLRDVQHGSIRLLGQELNGAHSDLQRALRRRLGFIFQAHNLHGSLTALQNVLMGLQVHGRSDPVLQAKAARHILTLLGLGDRMDYLPDNLSGGQKQRVAVAARWLATPTLSLPTNPRQPLIAKAARLWSRCSSGWAKCAGRPRSWSRMTTEFSNWLTAS